MASLSSTRQALTADLHVVLLPVGDRPVVNGGAIPWLVFPVLVVVFASSSTPALPPFTISPVILCIRHESFATGRFACCVCGDRWGDVAKFLMAGMGYFLHSRQSGSGSGFHAKCLRSPCAGRTSSGEQRRYIMSNNQKERFETFQCDSRYQECELCLVKIPYKELMKGTPSTEVPLEGWTNKRCYPDCTQAAEDRKQRTPAPVPPGGVPPKTLQFRTTSSFNVCGAGGVGDGDAG